MKKLAVLFVMSLVFASVAYAEDALTPVPVETAVQEEAAAKKYFCPMDGFESDKPGKCEKCGMDLVEKPAVEEAAAVAETVAE